MHQKRTKDQVQGRTEAGDQTQTPVLPREDDIVSETPFFFLSLHLSLVFSLERYLSSSPAYLPLFLPLCFMSSSSLVFISSSILSFSPLKLFSPFNIPSSFFPFFFPKTRYTMYLSLSNRHIYSCNYGLTALQDTIKTALQLYRHYQNILSSVFQALSRVHSVII